MSLQVWLPLCGNIQNYGLADVNVTSSGATVNTAGKIGSCYSFDGSDDYISLSGSSLYNIIKGGSQPFSIAMWVYHADATRAVLFGDYGLSGAINFNLELSTQHYLRFYWGGSPDTTPAATVISQSVWTHIAFIYDCQAVKFYVNGVLKYTLLGALSVKSKTSGSYYLGRDSRTGTTVLNGRINDFQIYDHCLSQAEIHELAKGKMIHLKLANNGFGNPNLITRSTFTSAPWAAAITGTETYKGKDAITVRNSTLYTQTSNGTTSIFPAITFAADTQYTLSLDWCDHLRSDGLNSALYLRFKYSDGTSSNVISPTSGPDVNWTHVKLTSTAGKTVAKMTTTYGNGGVVSIANLKLEVGVQETAYSPSTDELDNIEYDCSGYRHDAIKNAITPVFDSARYDAASVFNGSSSYIKVNDNTWMADRMPAMTINLWAKNSTWNANTHFFSCTQGGGFNTESGNSGYLRFLVHVYTSATEASVAYKFDSQELKLSDIPTDEWVMLTWVYDSFGTRTYINGELHHTYINNSYGIHFNTGARLFLGCEANAASPYQPWYNGQMSDFRIYATAMSQADIRLLYRASGFVDNEGNVFAGELREV